jgi:hypothetical protein
MIHVNFFKKKLILSKGYEGGIVTDAKRKFPDEQAQSSHERNEASA